MSNINIIRAWKDPIYRQSLSEEALAALPQNPAGLVELTDVQMETVGGAKWNSATTACDRVSYCVGCPSAVIACTRIGCSTFAC